MSSKLQQAINKLTNSASRSTIAVIDALTQRGSFRGEELLTIGQLRDQCTRLTAMMEQLEQVDQMDEATLDNDTSLKG